MTIKNNFFKKKIFKSFFFHKYLTIVFLEDYFYQNLMDHLKKLWYTFFCLNNSSFTKRLFMKRYMSICALTTIFACSLYGFEELPHQYFFNQDDATSKMRYMESVWISQHAATKNEYWTNITQYLPFIIGIYALQKSYTIKPDDKVTNYFKTILNAENIYFGLGIGCASTIIAEILNNYINDQAARTTVHNFFVNWEVNKNHTPDPLVPMFSLIAGIIEVQGEEIILKNAQFIVQNVQFAVIRNFDKQYESFLKAQSYSNLADTKTVTEIIKNSIEIIQKFK